MQFQGAFTALVTPFRNGAVDEERYRAFIEWQIEQGINGLVPCGTTGESATLTHQEHKDVIRICVEQVKGRVPVLAGAGSNNTREAVELTRYAKQAGADGALLITPYYNKPTQEGLYQHFKAIAAEVPMPFIVYNVPSRTGTNLCPETLARMKRDIPEVIGIKEATGNLIQVSEIIEYCGADFQVLSGDDFTVLPLLAVGGCGVISVSSNVVPAKMAELCRAFFEGDLATARRVHYELASINRAMFLETNPIPVKTALSMMGKMELELRLPMVPLQPANQSRLRDILSAAGIV
ncbi:4-hydroxy-tetrahydrodipicolinate synthase [Nitratidesulfovibrio sp. HK-II]|uniref:4-hydroxy-tetrahydrodipicolinate synthase n=1 Tax=Nitratidesulfovibrio sp. HK-II TaxID=2009266 RepID=UPI000E2FC52C|nr:4-hydroxy-tetrahydrodipicolinate synthase [Nitratidesulfovibrio sp. HK-II]GBO95731.1 4-hydroxy-tetrahydrodipicolinate synthase [Nitratidesulfovibrio sp. HK-II]